MLVLEIAKRLKRKKKKTEKLLMKTAKMEEDLKQVCLELEKIKKIGRSSEILCVLQEKRKHFKS